MKVKKASKNIWNDDGDISDIHNLSKTRHSICFADGNAAATTKYG